MILTFSACYRKSVSPLNILLLARRIEIIGANALAMEIPQLAIPANYFQICLPGSGISQKDRNFPKNIKRHFGTA